MDFAFPVLAIWFGAAVLVVLYVVWVARRKSAGKSYSADPAMGIGMTDVGRGGSGIGADVGSGSVGGDGSSS